MEILLQWVKKLAVFMILSSYMEHLLPAGYRRYFHMCMGLILILMVGTPLLRFVNAPLGSDFSYLLEDLRTGSGVYRFEGEAAKGFQDYYMEQYRDAVEAQIRQLAQGDGLEIEAVSFDVEEDINSSDYGRLLHLAITIYSEDGLLEAANGFRQNLSDQLGIDDSKIQINLEYSKPYGE